MGGASPQASRLHFIGMWKIRYQELLGTLPPPPPLPKAAPHERLIFHIDMDAFFASVAIRGRPELADKPVVVSWSSSAHGSGEVSSANYVARAFGIKASMCITRARQLCGSLVAVPYEFDKYAAAAEAMYRVLLATSPHVQVRA